MNTGVSDCICSEKHSMCHNTYCWAHNVLDNDTVFVFLPCTPPQWVISQINSECRLSAKIMLVTFEPLFMY